MKTRLSVLLVVMFLISSCGAMSTPITPSPTVTRTAIPPTPTLTATLTPIPGPELLTYLPTPDDLSQCNRVGYTVWLQNAYVWCSLPGGVGLSADVQIQTEPFTQADLNISNSITAVSVPLIGEGSIAAEIDEEGKAIVLLFYKGNAMVRVNTYNPNGKAIVDDGIALAQQVEKLLPDQVVSPLVLSFPDQLKEDSFKEYFDALDFNIMKWSPGGATRLINVYTENSTICIKGTPKEKSDKQWMAGLYDVQKQMIIKKNYYKMDDIPHCDGGPNYPEGELKGGDKYELWIAVDDTLVAVYPFETALLSTLEKTADKDGMLLLSVPAGEFTMGSDEGPERSQPAHTVYLDAFWIDQTEVTSEMYLRCVNEQGCELPDSRLPNFIKFSKGPKWYYYWDNPEFGKYPILRVSWEQADAYCRWAGRRLPTEAEWEKAARGTDKRIYPWGNNPPRGVYRLYDIGNPNKGGYNDYLELNFNIMLGHPRDVGFYSSGASPFGVLDMAGNVAEYVADWYDKNYYVNSPSSNPTGPVSGNFRVVRGGSWESNINQVFTQITTFYRAYYSESGTGPMTVGFRCAVSQ